MKKSVKYIEREKGKTVDSFGGLTYRALEHERALGGHGPGA